MGTCIKAKLQQNEKSHFGWSSPENEQKVGSVIL